MLTFLKYAILVTTLLLVYFKLRSLSDYRRAMFERVVAAFASGRYRTRKGGTNPEEQGSGRVQRVQCDVDDDFVVFTCHRSEGREPRYLLQVYHEGFRVPYSFGIGCIHAKIDEPRLAEAFRRVWRKDGRP